MTPHRHRLEITSEELVSLDLRQFNNGKDPYPEGDASLAYSFKRGLDFYRYVVGHKTQFTGGGRVLDLLCGAGRWAMFLAEENDTVIGIDRLKDCTNLATNMCRHFGFENCRFVAADVSHTRKFGECTFDYVWMWSALQYVHRGEVLAEVNRVLKPGGRLYVGNYNSTGLMLTHLMKGVEQNAINEGASQWALSALVHGPGHDANPNYATVECLEEVCGRYGLALIGAAGEGALDLSCPGNVDPKVRPAVVFEHYFSTVEFIAEKTGPIARASRFVRFGRLARRIRQALR